ncbi:hypothetical protein NC652_017082 [Populus alba x Populus x berolinensis]|nr:hypothetical protein NC652_017082 [Populus alba x Populus x berolinensis]
MQPKWQEFCKPTAYSMERRKVFALLLRLVSMFARAHFIYFVIKISLLKGCYSCLEMKDSGMLRNLLC